MGDGENLHNAINYSNIFQNKVSVIIRARRDRTACRRSVSDPGVMICRWKNGIVCRSAICLLSQRSLRRHCRDGRGNRVTWEQRRG